MALKSLTRGKPIFLLLSSLGFSFFLSFLLSFFLSLGLICCLVPLKGLPIALGFDLSLGFRLYSVLDYY